MGLFRRSTRRASERAASGTAGGRSRPLPSIETPLYPDFTRRHGATTRALTEACIPSAGPSPVLQGELVRAVDKLWFEGQDNGNINWDADFESFCDLLESRLLVPGLLDDVDRSMAAQSLAILRDCGRQAYVQKPAWARDPDHADIKARYPGLLSTPVDPTEVRLAYVYDDLYRHLMDCVAIFALAHPEPIPYTAPDGFRR